MIGRSSPVFGEFLIRTRRNRSITVLPIYEPYVLSVVIVQGGRCLMVYVVSVHLYLFRPLLLSKTIPRVRCLRPCSWCGLAVAWMIYDASRTAKCTFLCAEQ